MPRTISEFVSQIKTSKGFARTSKFEVVITPPSNLESLIANSYYYANGEARPTTVGPAGQTAESSWHLLNWTNPDSFIALKRMKGVGESLTLLCDTISMPGFDLQTHGVQYASEPKVDVVQTHGFAGTIDATFLLSTDLRERHFFEQWMNLTVNRETHKANYYDDYIGSMEIYQLSSDGNKEIRTYGMKAYDVYPATIAGIEYSAESSSSVAKQTVKFAYKEWKNLGDTDLSLRPF